MDIQNVHGWKGCPDDLQEAIWAMVVLHDFIMTLLMQLCETALGSHGNNHLLVKCVLIGNGTYCHVIKKNLLYINRLINSNLDWGCNAEDRLADDPMRV